MWGSVHNDQSKIDRNLNVFGREKIIDIDRKRKDKGIIIKSRFSNNCSVYCKVYLRRKDEKLQTVLEIEFLIELI